MPPFLDLYQLGEVIIVSPEKLAVKELAGAVTAGMKEQDISLDGLLAELREGSHEYKKEEWGLLTAVLLIPG